MNEVLQGQMQGLFAPKAGSIAYWAPVAVEAESRSLLAWEHVINVSLVGCSGSAAKTLNLPLVSEARGGVYTIHLTDDGSGTDTLVVAAIDTPGLITYGTSGTCIASGATTIGTLTANNDFQVLYSDGVHWIVLNDITT